MRDGRLDVLLPQFGVEASIKVDGVLKDGGLAWDDVVVRVFDRVVVRVTVAKRDEDADDAVVLGLVEPAPPRSSGEPAPPAVVGGAVVSRRTPPCLLLPRRPRAAGLLPLPLPSDSAVRDVDVSERHAPFVPDDGRCLASQLLR